MKQLLTLLLIDLVSYAFVSEFLALGEATIKQLLRQGIIDPGTPLAEVRDFIES